MFIHYSDSNIREKTLLEVLQSPLFMAYHDGQPFNENHLRPCPMLENPELLREMIAKVGGFPYYKHFTAQRAVSQIPRGFILLKKGLCKTQSPFFWLGWRDSNPRGDGVKVRCLTAWRQPNIRYPKSITYFRPLVKRFKQRKAARKQVFLLRTAPYPSLKLFRFQRVALVRAVCNATGD